MPDVRADDDLARVRVGRAGAAGVGTGGMQTKLEAARIATGAGHPGRADLGRAGRRGAGGRAGRHPLPPTGKRRPTRLLWLAHATEPKGALVLDDGAVRAVTERRASLLAAGVTGVTGTFVAGDPVDLAGTDGVAGGPRAGQLRRRRAARACSAAPPTTSSASSGRRTSARSCTATTWCCCPGRFEPVRRAIFWLLLVALLVPAVGLTVLRLLQPPGGTWVRLVSFTPLALAPYLLVLLLVVWRLVVRREGRRRWPWLPAAVVVAALLGLHAGWVAPMVTGEAPAAASRSTRR